MWRDMGVVLIWAVSFRTDITIPRVDYLLLTALTQNKEAYIADRCMTGRDKEIKSENVPRNPSSKLFLVH